MRRYLKINRIMWKNSKLLLLLCLLCWSHNIVAQSHWSFDYRLFQYDMTVYFLLEKDGSVVSDLDDYEVAAFIGSECHGVAKVLEVEKDEVVKKYGYLRIYSNQADDEIVTFRVYQKTTEKESTLSKNITFHSLSVVGMPSDPLLLDMTLLTVTLDETSTVAPEAAAGVNASVKRTIKANEWSTIVLPFAMTQAQLKAAFGNDVALKHFTGYNATENTGGEVVGIKVNFVDALALEANHPYLIKVSNAVGEFSVNDVNIVPTTVPCVEYDNGETGAQRQVLGRFVGTYVAGGKVPENGLFLSENKFWYSKGNSKIKAFRAYFDFHDVLAEMGAAESRIVMQFDDDETTGISALLNDKEKMINDKPLFDLQGRKVRISSSANSKMKPGLYIRNGKKVVIK